MLSSKIYTGPKIFLKRLQNQNVNLNGVELINPDLNSVKNIKNSNKILIARLDGTSYYDFSKENLENFLFLRGKRKMGKVIQKLPKFKLSYNTNRYLNRYLDRTNLWLINNADALIFQSQLSLRMHQGFYPSIPLK